MVLEHGRGHPAAKPYTDERGLCFISSHLDPRANLKWPLKPPRRPPDVRVIHPVADVSDPWESRPVKQPATKV